MDKKSHDFTASLRWILGEGGGGGGGVITQLLDTCSLVSAEHAIKVLGYANDCAAGHY